MSNDARSASSAPELLENRAAPVRAATLLLVRDSPSFQVLMVERHRNSSFGPGALVFPGGKLDPEDCDPMWVDQTAGPDGLDTDARALRICAIRETLEEASILLARSATDGSWARGEEACAARAGGAPFRQRLRALGLVLDPASLTSFSRWITPRAAHRRFDATFFIAADPEGQSAACDGRETVNVEWIEPRTALQLARNHERQLMFPTRMDLELLSQSRTAVEAIAAAATRPIAPVEPWLERRGTGEVMRIVSSEIYAPGDRTD